LAGGRVHAGEVLFALLFLAPGLLALAGMARRHRGKGDGKAPRGGIVSGWLARRHALRVENTKHYNAMLRESARHWNKLVEQLHAARIREEGRGGRPANGGTDGPDGSPRPPRQTVPSTVTSLGDPAQPQHRRGGNGKGAADQAGGTGAPGTGSPPGPPYTNDPHVPPSADEPPAKGSRTTAPPPSAPPAPEPPARGAAQVSPPERPAPGLSAAPSSLRPLEGTIVTTPVAPEAVPGVEMIVEGLRAIYAHAMGGNIQAKRRGVLALVEVARRAGVTALTLSRSMGEPGQHYGTAVTERLARMAAGFTATATAGTEADAELYAILTTTPAETMAAGKPMPHHGQFAESGSH
jgi:hypothetical protein